MEPTRFPLTRAGDGWHEHTEPIAGREYPAFRVTCTDPACVAPDIAGAPHAHIVEEPGVLDEQEAAAVAACWAHGFRRWVSG